jgi:uncharacterized lipoprotein YmbA
MTTCLVSFSRLRARRVALGSAAIAVLAGACSSPTVPEDCFYRLASRAGSAASAPSAAPASAPALRLHVAEVSVAAALAGDRLLAEVGPVRVEPYTGHRWIAPLDLLLRESVVDRFAAIGILHVATADRSVPVLRLRVEAFQEVDAPDRWSARVSARAALTGGTDDEPQWTVHLDEVEPAQARHPEAVVVALSAAWHRLVDRLAARVRNAR